MAAVDMASFPRMTDPSFAVWSSRVPRSMPTEERCRYSPELTFGAVPGCSNGRGGLVACGAAGAAAADAGAVARGRAGAAGTRDAEASGGADAVSVGIASGAGAEEG